MDQPHRPAPVVTVQHRGASSLDLLDSGPEESWTPGPRARAAAVAAVAVAVVAGLVVGGLELRDRRAAAAEEHRADATVDLAVLPDTSASGSATRGGGSLRLDLRVRNDGPRDVEVAGGSYAGFALLRPVQVPAGGERPLPFTLEVDCADGRPAPLPFEEGAQLQVRTPSTVRTVRVPVPQVPLDASEAERICGFYALEEALDVLQQDPSLVGESLVLRLELSGLGREPVDLVAVEAEPGLSAVLREPEGGPPVPLPVTLPAPERRSVAPVSYEVAITVADCAATRPVPDGAGLTLRTGDGQGGTAEVVLGYQLQDELLAAACPR